MAEILSNILDFVIGSNTEVTTRDCDQREYNRLMDRHPGIRIEKVPVTATVAGLIFVGGTLYIFLVGVPVLRLFLLIGLAGGLLAGALVYLARRRR